MNPRSSQTLSQIKEGGLASVPAYKILIQEGSEGQFPLDSHWTYLLQILSQLCFQRVAFSGNYEIVAISTDKNTFFNDLDYKADIGQHFNKSEKSARRCHCHKIIKTNLKTLVSPLLTCPQGSQGCQKMRQDPLNMPVEVWCTKIAPKLKNI